MRNLICSQYKGTEGVDSMCMKTLSIWTWVRAVTDSSGMNVYGKGFRVSNFGGEVNGEKMTGAGMVEDMTVMIVQGTIRQSSHT